MATFRAHKVVAALPSQLAANAVYLVRVGGGFDLYATDSTGSIAHKLNTGLTWNTLATEWDVEPSLVAAIDGGDVYTYVLEGVTRYRLVPDPYVAALDVFYEAFDGTTLSGPIVARGRAA